MARDDDGFGILLEVFEGKRATPEEKRRGLAPPATTGLQEGDSARARVVSLAHDAVFVTLGVPGKLGGLASFGGHGCSAEGILDMDELRDATGRLAARIGDELDVVIMRTGAPGRPHLVAPLRTLSPTQLLEFERAQREGTPVEGIVKALCPGGVEVMIAGVRASCSQDELDTAPLRRAGELAEFVGQRLSFRVTAVHANLGRVELSRRALLADAVRQVVPVVDAAACGAVLGFGSGPVAPVLVEPLALSAPARSLRVAREFAELVALAGRPTNDQHRR